MVIAAGQLKELENHRYALFRWWHPGYLCATRGLLWLALLPRCQFGQVPLPRLRGPTEAVKPLWTNGYTAHHPSFTLLVPC